MYTIGVDLGGTNIATGIVDEQYNIVAKAVVPTGAGRDFVAMVEDIDGCIDKALNAAGVDLHDCRAIGIGSPGTCDGDNGVVIHAYNLGWFDVPICRMLSERFGLPAYLGNDADCAALGEVVAGAAKGSDSAVMITLGTGVGGGMVIGGSIFAGYRTLGGELGHICIQMDGEKCTCGQRGCWEAYASATALIHQGERAAKEHPESALAKAGKLDGKKIFTAANAGDETAAEVVRKYCEYVGVGLVSMVNIFFPEVIIMGGGVANAGEALLTPVREYVGDHFFVGDKRFLPRIVKATLGDDAGIIGAAAHCR